MSVVHEGHTPGAGWLLFVGSKDVARDVVPEVAQGGHRVDPCPPFSLLGVAGVCTGLGVGHVGLVVAGVALGVHPAPARDVRQGVRPSQRGAPRLGPLWGAGSRRQGWRAGNARVRKRGGRRRRGSLGHPPPGRPPGQRWLPGCVAWWVRCGGVACPGLRGTGGAAVLLRGCGGCRARPVRRLVVQCVAREVVWVGGMVVVVVCGVW